MAPIVTLFATEERVAVRAEALAEGVRVVVQGNERMFPGQPLNVLPDREVPATPGVADAVAEGEPAGGEPGQGG